MYSSRSGLILCFHGCDKSIVDIVITGKASLKESTNKYDWIGHGVYFWDNSPSRALDFASYLRDHPNKHSKQGITTPAVIGAVINLGFCLDLLDFENLQFIKQGHEILSMSYNASGWELPQNKTIGSTGDLLLRELDCAVIETIHQVRKRNKLRPFDSVRGVFWEGEELYPNAGFREKDHIQICMRNPNCIKGYFLPRTENEKYAKI